MPAALRTGVDLGGTKIEALVLNATGTERARHRVPSPQGDYDATMRAIATLVDRVEQQAGGGRGPVGIGIPGALSPASGLVKNANSTWLIGRPFDRDLQAALGRPVRLANDANCFALSEATDGAGAGAHSVFGVILGTGTGGGIVVDGRLHAGPNLIAGEWGHVPLPWRDAGDDRGPPCYCGKHGCIETYLSGPALSRAHHARSGESLSPAEIEARAAAGDGTAELSLRHYEANLAKALAMVITILDPEVIVLGGGLSNLARLYDNVPRLWSSFAFSDELSTRLAPARHGDASGVRGAAWLWPAESAS